MCTNRQQHDNHLVFCKNILKLLQITSHIRLSTIPLQIFFANRWFHHLKSSFKMGLRNARRCGLSRKQRWANRCQRCFAD